MVSPGRTKTTTMCGMCKHPTGTTLQFVRHGLCATCGGRTASATIGTYVRDTVDERGRLFHLIHQESGWTCGTCGKHGTGTSYLLCKEANSVSLTASLEGATP